MCVITDDGLDCMTPALEGLRRNERELTQKRTEQWDDTKEPWLESRMLSISDQY